MRSAIRTRMAGLVRALAIGAIAGSAIASAEAQRLDVKDLVGRRVVTTRTTPLREGRTLIEKDGLFHVYTVDAARPGKVHIVTPGIQAWVEPSRVVPLEDAGEHFSELIRKKPGAELYNKRGLIHHELKAFDEAVADFDEAIKRDARYAVAYNNRGLSLQNRGEYDRAIADYDRAVELDPKLAMAFGNRGLCRQARGDNAGALADYDRAVALDPRLAMAFGNRAILLATCRDPAFRDGKKAVESATRACELTEGKDPYFLDILAAAHATAGDYEEAVRCSEKAVELAADEGRKDAYRTRLEHYRAALSFGR